MSSPEPTASFEEAYDKAINHYQPQFSHDNRLEGFKFAILAAHQKAIRQAVEAKGVMTPELKVAFDQIAVLEKAGNELCDRALYTSREFDGTHRLGSAAAHWADTVSKLHLMNGDKANLTPGGQS